MDKRNFTFEEVFEQNERRIYYYIHRLNIRDTHHEYYQEGLFALWNAYETYQPNKGPMATYFNYMIRNRLIDLIRKETRLIEKEQMAKNDTVSLNDGNSRRTQETKYPLYNTADTLPQDPFLWKKLRKHLTNNQWKWVYYFVICEMSLADIATQEKTTLEAVKSWAKQTRKKLRDKEFQEIVGWELEP